MSVNLHMQHTYPVTYLLNESYSLLVRLKQVRPFSMTMPMVRGASVSDKSLKAVMELLEKGKQELRKNIYQFIETLKSAPVGSPDIILFQSGFSILKLRFNTILDQLDIFADVLSQRSEHEVGIWLSGLDVLAADGMKCVEPLFEVPSLMVYLDRGHGAAIRRARTRLPGGDENPAAIIQIPRERMVGNGIASSLIHEVGHQVAALLNLVPTLKDRLVAETKKRNDGLAWKCFERWISEIVCDVWGVGHLGIGATSGLMGVVTLPKYFQFRIDLADPHPAPYLRVFLSCAFGKALFPHVQWDKAWNLWKAFYPPEGLKTGTMQIIREVEQATPEFVELVLHHSTKEMKGRRLKDLFPVARRRPEELQRAYQLIKTGKLNSNRLPPTLVFAILGQAKFDLLVNAATESAFLTRQLTQWAFTRK